MPWNPELYNIFKTIRYEPFYDLMELITSENIKTAVDLGCGTGEQTAILSEHFPETSFLGIDASAEMLEKSALLTHKYLQFEKKATEDWLQTPATYDLIFSNAALQWSDNHQKLFPELISKLNTNGQLALQIPDQPHNVLNILLTEMANETPYKSQLNNYNRYSSVLSLDTYTRLLFENGMKKIEVFKKVYPIIAPDADMLFRFISGSALLPYMERLDEEQQQAFEMAFKTRITDYFRNFPAIYPFKRILIYAIK